MSSIPCAGTRTLKPHVPAVCIPPSVTSCLFGAIDTACKAISNMVKRSQLPSSETLGYQGEMNIQGEDQKKLDVLTNDLLKRALRFTGRLGVLASEEEDVPVRFFFFLSRNNYCSCSCFIFCFGNCSTDVFFRHPFPINQLIFPSKNR